MKIRADGFNFPQKNYIAAADCSRAAFEWIHPVSELQLITIFIVFD